MTLAPSTDFGIRGHEGKAYKVNEICAAPGCGKRSIHTHHLWPRSYLRGQPYEWITTSDGIIIGNRIGLCVEHHDDVTGNFGGHRAKIRFAAGMFWWDEPVDNIQHDAEGRAWNTGGWMPIGPLAFQPPGALPAAEATPEGSPEDTTDVCPSCGKPTHTKPRKPLPARKTTQWTLIVPEDAEIGSDVLDGWADDLAVILGFSDESSRLRRYHAVATGLAWVIQNREQFVADLNEAARA